MVFVSKTDQNWSIPDRPFLIEFFGYTWTVGSSEMSVRWSLVVKFLNFYILNLKRNFYHLFDDWNGQRKMEIMVSWMLWQKKTHQNVLLSGTNHRPLIPVCPLRPSQGQDKSWFGIRRNLDGRIQVDGRKVWPHAFMYHIYVTFIKPGCIFESRNRNHQNCDIKIMQPIKGRYESDIKFWQSFRATIKS